MFNGTDPGSMRHEHTRCVHCTASNADKKSIYKQWQGQLCWFNDLVAAVHAERTEDSANHRLVHFINITLASKPLDQWFMVFANVIYVMPRGQNDKSLMPNGTVCRQLTTTGNISHAIMHNSLGVGKYYEKYILSINLRMTWPCHHRSTYN